MLSGANAFEISDIQEDETQAQLTKLSDCELESSTRTEDRAQNSEECREGNEHRRRIMQEGIILIGSGISRFSRGTVAYFYGPVAMDFNALVRSISRRFLLGHDVLGNFSLGFFCLRLRGCCSGTAAIFPLWLPAFAIHCFSWSTPYCFGLNSRKPCSDRHIALRSAIRTLAALAQICSETLRHQRFKLKPIGSIESPKNSNSTFVDCFVLRCF
jgi:hypothetical protein